MKLGCILTMETPKPITEIDLPRKLEVGQTACRVVDLDYIRQLKTLPDCPFYDFDGENIGA